MPASWHGLASRHYVYVVSPFYYAAAGVAVYVSHHRRATELERILEPLCLCIQALLSYLSDVDTLGRNSGWHAVDRLFAYSFTIIRASYSAWYAAVYSSLQLRVFSFGLLCGIFCIRASWSAVLRRDCPAFLRWHSVWHASLPLTALAFVRCAPT